MKLNLCIAACALISTTPALAQTTVATPMPATTTAVLAGPADQTVLRVGTPVALKTREALTTNGKKLKIGTRFQLEVADAVMLNNVVVMPVGTPVMGEVTDVRNKGMWGKSGRINARVLYATVNGRQVRMTGAIDDKGTTGTGAVVGSLVLLPVAGFFVTGTSANIPMGTPVSAFIDEDVPVAFSTVAATPMVVTTPAPTPAIAQPAVATTILTPIR